MEREIVVAAVRGDAQAFYELINRHKTQLYRIAFRYLKSEQDALEVIQETTFRAYRSIKKLKEPEYFKTWLIRILINACHNELKRQRVQTSLRDEVSLAEVTAGDESTEPGGSVNLQRLDILSALERLELKNRQVIELKYFEDLTIREISLILERPEGTIKTWLTQSYKQLREYLAERRENRG